MIYLLKMLGILYLLAGYLILNEFLGTRLHSIKLS